MKTLLSTLTLFLLLTVSAHAASLSDAVFDAALGIVANATRLVLCSSEPATYAGVAGVTLATDTSITFTGPADHTSGRKVTLAAQTGITPSSNGTVTRGCLTDGSSILFGCFNITSQAVTTAQTWDVPAVIIAITDPS